MMTRTHHQRRGGRIRFLMALTCLILPGVLALGQEEPATEGAEVANVARPLRFNFENAPFEEVINYFSRAAGVPVIRESEVPGGTLTYLSPRAYDLAEGLRVLNTILQTKGLYLRHDSEFLYLGKLENMSTEAVRTFIGEEVPDNVTEDQIITAVIPLENLIAASIAEQLTPLIAPYGKLLPLPQQNALVLTETAANCRRLQKIIANLDDEVPPSNQSRLFALRYAKAPTVLTSLKVLAEEQRTTFVISADGKRVKVDDAKMEGLRLEADARTNSIIAVGPASRLEQIGDFIEMLDVPDPSVAREMATFSLQTISPTEAVRHLSQLFTGLPTERAPTILPLDEVGKLTIVGDAGVLVQATALLQEIDGPIDASGQAQMEYELASQPRVAVIPVRFSNPQGAMTAVKQLLNSRQQRAVKMVPAPDNKALIVAASASDVGTVKSLLEAIDIEKPIDREVRIVQINRGEPGQVLGRTRELYDLQVDTALQQNAVVANLDTRSRSVTLIGTKQAVERFSRTLTQTQQGLVLVKEERQYELTHATPSQLIRQLGSLTGQLLRPADGSTFEAPETQPVDELDTLIVRALPEQYETIERLIEMLDRAQPGDVQFRILPVRDMDPALLVSRVREFYDRQTALMDPDIYGSLQVDVDRVSGSLLLTGPSAAINEWNSAMTQARQLMPPKRTRQLIELQIKPVAEVLPLLLEKLAGAEPLEPAREMPAPIIEAVESENALLVTAEDIQHRQISTLLRELDRLDPEANQFRIMPMQGEDPTPLITRAQELYDEQTAPLHPDIFATLDVQVDTASGNVLLRGHAQAIQKWTEVLTQARQLLPPRRTTQILDLREAKAADIVAPLQEYLDTADSIDASRQVAAPTINVVARTNSLLITAEAAQHQLIGDYIRRLDVLEPGDIPPLRLLQLRAADATAIARMLTDQYSKRSAEERRQKPVDIRADSGTNTLIVSAHEELFEDIKGFVETLNEENSQEADRVTEIYPLKVARAQDLATAMDTLYPEPPMPRDRRGTPMPWLAKPKEVNVSADPASNSLIVDAPASRIPAFKALVEKLDRVELPPAAELRTYRVSTADGSYVSRTLQNLARQGTLAAPPQPGKKQVSVTIDFEPRSETLIVAGDEYTFSQVERILEDLQAIPINREVRLAQISRGDPQQVLSRAMDLYEIQSDIEKRENDIEATLEPDTRTVTIIGARTAIDRFSRTLGEVQRGVFVQREARTYQLASAQPSQITQPLTSLARQLLDPADGSTYEAPTVEAIDQLDSLLVRATAEQFEVIDGLIETLDSPQPGDKQFRIVPIEGLDPTPLVERTDALYAQQVVGLGEDYLNLAVEIDTASGNVLLTGTGEAIREWTDLLNEVRQLVPPQRTTEMVELRQARASDVMPALMELINATDSIDPSREVPPPTIQMVARTNSLLVTAERAQHAMVRDLVSKLDVLEPGELPPLRLLQVRAADATAIARMLMDQYDKRSQEDRREKPVDVRADAATNTLIVSAHEDLFTEIKDFVTSLNEEATTEADRVTQIYPLKVARAEDLAAAMDKLYPEPPMPRDRRGTPMPWLAQPKEVNVSADAGSNSLIVDAPASRIPAFEALVEKLDRVELPPTAELRTYRVSSGDPAVVATTLQNLAKQGTLSAPPQPGKKPVQVTIDHEPISKTLIVAGDEYTFSQVEAVLADLQAVPIERELRVFPVIGADPEEVLTQALSIYEAQTAEIPDAGAVDVTIDSRSNSLMVVAAPEEMVRFLSIVEELQQTLGPPQDIQLYNLQHADAAEIVRFLTDLLESSQPFRTATGRDPIIEAIEANNSLLIAADETQHAIIRALIDSMDVISTDELPPLRILQLRAADATNLARALGEVYDRRPSEQRAKMPVSIRADANSNTLLVSAHPELFTEIEQIVTDLNMAGGMSREGREIRIFPLKFARAEELAETIDEMYPEPPVPVDYRGRPLPQARPEREVRVRADKFTNSIIVDASMQRMAGFEQLVNALDKREIPDDIEMRTYTIVSADLDVVSNTVRRLAESGSLMPGAPMGAMSTPITVEVEPISRTLIVSGPQAMFTEIEKLLSEIDAQADLPTMVMRFYKLKHTRADQIRDMLQQLLASQIRETLLKDGSPESRVEALLEVTADPRSNTLIIRAPEWLTPVADQLIEQLDDPLAAIGRPVIRIIALTFADADSVAESLNRSLPNIEMPSGESVQVLAAAGSNALILTGREKDLGKVEEMVQALDSRPSLDAINVETFPLKYADASTIAATVERLLVDQQMQDPRMLQYLIRYSRNSLPTQPRVQVEADVRTNTLIVSARQQTLALASDIIEQLDREPDTPQREMAVFTPKRGRSMQIADLARRVLSETASESLRERVELIAEAQSTAVLVLGTTEQIAKAMELLETFDDQAASAPMMDLQIVDIAHLDAPALAQTLGPMLTDQNRWPAELRALAQAGVSIARPTVTADAALNRLLISAPSPLMDVARMLITQLDAPPPDTGASMLVRVFPLTSSQAETVAVTLQSALDAKLRSERLPANAPKPVITAEPSSNAIVVTATSEHMDEVESLLLPLDVAADPEQLQVQTVYLQHARAENIAPVVEQLLAPEQIDSWIRMQAYARGRPFETGPDVRVAAEPRLNAIVITAPASVLKVAAEMVTQLDTDPTALAVGPQRLIRVLSFNNADAAQLAQNLEAVFLDTESSDPPPVIRVDAGSNSLIVRGTAEQLATIEEIATQLDRATIASQRQMRMIPIDPSRANARELAETLQRILQDRSGGAEIEVITIEQLMERQDSQSRGENSEEPEVRTVGGLGEVQRSPFRLTLPEIILSCVFAQTGDADAAGGLAPADEDEAREAASGLSDEPPLTIAVDESTNSLIVVGSPRLTDRLAQLAAEIQQQMPAEPGRVRVIAMPNLVDARQMANLLTATVRNIGQRDLNNPGGFTGRVAVIPDPAGGSLVVSANDTDFERVGELIVALAKPAAAGEVVVKVYGLKTITADQAAARVQDLFGAARGRQAQAARAQYMELEGDKFLVEPGSVQVVANSISEQLIVAAPPETVPLIDRFVTLIDQTSSGDRVAIRRFELENAEARAAADSLQQAFDARRVGRANQEPIRARFIADARTNTLLVAASDEQFVEVKALLEEIDRTLEDDEYPLTIVAVQTALPSRVAEVAQQVIFAKDPGIKTRTTVVADDDSGLILVRAPEEEVALLQELAGKLDQTPGRNVPVHTVALENSDASRVAAAIEDFLSRRERIASASGRNRRTNQPKVAVIGDTRTQSLIIAAADEDYAEIQQLLETLDAPGGIGELQFQVYPLAHARAADMRETLEELVNELGWMNRYSGSGNDADRILLRTDARLNAVIVIGEGDSFRLIEELLAVVDVPKPEGAAVAVRIARLENADMRLVQQAVQQAVGGRRRGAQLLVLAPAQRRRRLHRPHGSARAHSGLHRPAGEGRGSAGAGDAA